MVAMRTNTARCYAIVLALTSMGGAACVNTDARDAVPAGPPPACPEGMTGVPGGVFIAGSDRDERDMAYRIGSAVARKARWFDRWERKRRTLSTDAFCIGRTAVTQQAYAAFAAVRDHRAPGISRQAYQRQGFLVHDYDTVVTGYLWQDGKPPPQLRDHPVVLVDRFDAAAYCRWHGGQVGRKCRLPTEAEWEKAARGTDGRYFPWGNTWDARRLNSGHRYGGTTPVTAHPAGASPYGALDMVGNVFEWTAGDFLDEDAPLRGCSWDDARGICRAAARHGRPPDSRHVLIGFRCVCAGD